MALVARYQTNRFRVPKQFESDIAAVAAPLGCTFASRDCAPGEDGTVMEIECSITGDGKPAYAADGVPEGILKMTGNMDAFYSAVQPLLSDGSAMIFTSYRDEDGTHLNIDGAVVTKDAVVKKNFMSDMIRIAAEAIGDEHWSTDFHVIESAPQTDGGETENVATPAAENGEPEAVPTADPDPVE